MRLTKFLIIVLAVTLLALLYVYQQSKIIQIAYKEQKRLAYLESLMDKNNYLRYNISHLMSLSSIAELWREEDFEWPNRKQLVNLIVAQQAPSENKHIKKKENIFARLFGLKSQAEAKPIKPH